MMVMKIRILHTAGHHDGGTEILTGLDGGNLGMATSMPARYPMLFPTARLLTGVLTGVSA